MANIYCQNCGAPNPMGSAFCTNCGQAIGQPAGVPVQPYQQPQPAGYQPAGYQEPYEESNNTDKTLTYVLIGVIAVLVLAIAGLGIWWFNKQSKEKQAAEVARQEQLAKMKEQQDSLAAATKAAEEKAAEAERKVAEATRHPSRPVSVPASQATRVVINGHGVRMRTGPGLQYPFPQTYDGHAYTVSKGTSLPFLGDYGGWYAVAFEGGKYYVSAQYSYLR